MPHRSHSTQEDPKHEPHPWLEEKVYTRLRQRTVDLVTRSVDALRKNKQRVSLATVAARSRELDPEGKGISESAILDNPEARAYYEEHRSWRGPSRKRAKPLVVVQPSSPGPIKPGRDEQRVRQRFHEVQNALRIAAMTQLQQQAGNPYGITLQPFGHAMAFRTASIQDLDAFNHVIGLQTTDLPFLDAMVAFFDLHHLSCYVDLGAWHLTPEVGQVFMNNKVVDWHNKVVDRKVVGGYRSSLGNRQLFSNNIVADWHNKVVDWKVRGSLKKVFREPRISVRLK